MNKIAVYGDSIAFGYGTDNESWFDLLPEHYQKSKFAFNGARIIDVLSELSESNENFDIIFIAVGINDLFGISDFNYAYLLEQYEEIVKIATKKTKQVIIQAILPVIENSDDYQDFYQRKEPLNLIVESFNIKLRELSLKYNCLFVDAYAEFINFDLKQLYCDEVHLNHKGQQKLLEIYSNSLNKL